MDKAILQGVLYYNIPNKYVNLEEYQDKFYLKKEIQELIPGKSDSEIYNAIEFAYTSLEPPRNKMHFISILIDRLNN